MSNKDAKYKIALPKRIARYARNAAISFSYIHILNHFFTKWLVLPNFLFNVNLFHYLLNVFVDRSLFFLVTFCLIKDSSKKYGSDLLMIYKHD